MLDDEIGINPKFFSLNSTNNEDFDVGTSQRAVSIEYSPFRPP